MDDAKGPSGRIRAEQMRELAEVAVPTAIFVAINPTLVLLVFWQAASHSLLLAWWAANIFYCGLVLLDRDWRQAAHSPWPHLRLTARTTFLGLIWGALPFLLIPVADTGQMLMIGLIAAGMTASGAVRLAIVPAAAYGFVWGLTLPSIVAFFVCEVPFAILVSAFMLSGSLFISRHIASFSKFQTRLLLDKIELGQQNDTIHLLLKDFSSQSSDWLWQTDASGRIVDPSPRFCQAAGRSAAQIGAMPFQQLFGPDPGIFDQLVERREILRDLQQSVRIGGELCHWSLTGQPVFDASGEFSGYRGVAADVTDKVAAITRLSFLAHHDPLTGLHNRIRLREEIDQALALLAKGGSLSLFLIDLDQFKAINDTMGHPVGDELLVAVAGRLKRKFGRSSMVARLGGDEFAVLHRHSSADWNPCAMCAEILSVFDWPFPLSEAELTVNTSVGVALVEQTSAKAADDLIRNADLALYRAKAEGCGYRIFDPSMNKAAQRRHELRQALEAAIERDELRLLFQPIVDLNAGQVVCLEALLRWDSEKFGEVSPTEFIPIAEESGLINPIGQFVLSHALAAAATWPSQVSVAVNLSPVQFRDENLIEKIAEARASSGLKAGRLELEITEMTFLSASSAMTEAMRELKALGVSLALDDFGTGYSSLSYLRNFPFDKVKIDRSFLNAGEIDEASQAIVHTVIELGHALRMRVTAEGIERPSQVAMLRAMGCQQIQGYIVSSAVPEAEARALARGKHQRRIREALGLAPADECAPGRQASAA